MPTPNYAELVAKAEEAVTAVKDPELRRIAFQKVLDDLLGSNTSKTSGAKPTAKKKAATTKKAKKKRASSRKGPAARISELVDENFFQKPKTIAQVKAELENRGHHIPVTSMSGPLQKLCQKRVLRRQKLNTSGKKQTYAYSHW